MSFKRTGVAIGAAVLALASCGAPVSQIGAQPSVTSALAPVGPVALPTAVPVEHVAARSVVSDQGDILDPLDVAARPALSIDQVLERVRASGQIRGYLESSRNLTARLGAFTIGNSQGRVAGRAAYVLDGATAPCVPAAADAPTPATKPNSGMCKGTFVFDANTGELLLGLETGP